MAPSDTLISFCFFSAAFMVAASRVKRVKRVFIPDFMRGLSFVKGAYVGELGPGAYETVGTKKHIETVDMRPQPVILDRTFYLDVWKNAAFLSISADLLVLDPHCASTALKNEIRACLPIARNVVRSTLARSTIREDADYLLQLAGEIEQAVNLELQLVGAKVHRVQVVEFWVRPITGELSGVAQ